MARNKSQTTEKKQRKVHPNSLKNLKKFEPGPDPRRNMNGPVPKDVQELNALIDEILAEEAVDAQGNKMQKMRVVLNRLIMSKSPVGQIHILDRRYGKVKEQIDLSNSDGSLSPKLPDEERLARMKELAVMIAKEVKSDNA